MFTSVDKALVALVMGALYVATSFGVMVPAWASQTSIESVIGILTPILVYFVPNKK